MPEAINGQELFCHLLNYKLTNPMVDEWESVKKVTSIWVDCWFGGAIAEFRFVDELKQQLNVYVNAELTIKMRYVGGNDRGYPLQIEVKDPEADNGFSGDRYNVDFRS